MLPKITIITPSYNQAQYLEETIDSVLSQGYENLEYMVVDGGSTDGSKEIIQKYASHFAYWACEKDQGQTDAILKGMSRMSGDVFNWINSDDLLTPGALEHVAEQFSDPNVNALCGPIEMFGGRKITIHPPAFLKGESLVRTFGLDGYNQPGTYFRTSCFHQFGLPDKRLHYVMDKEWFMRYLLHFGLKGLMQTDFIMARYRIHDQTKTASQGDVFMDEYADVIRAYCAYNQADKLESLMLQKYANLGFNVPDGTPKTELAWLNQLVGMFLLRRYDEVKCKSDFDYALSLCSQIDWSQCDLEDKMQNRLNELMVKTNKRKWWKYKLSKIISKET